MTKLDFKKTTIDFISTGVLYGVEESPENSKKSEKPEPEPEHSENEEDACIESEDCAEEQLKLDTICKYITMWYGEKREDSLIEFVVNPCIIKDMDKKNILNLKLITEIKYKFDVVITHRFNDEAVLTVTYKDCFFDVLRSEMYPKELEIDENESRTWDHAVISVSYKSREYKY
jgi:hypothetical protein